MEDSVLQKLQQVVHDYHMPDNAKKLLTESRLLALCGVTAAGKNTIIDYLVQHHEFVEVISHTTRAPRENHGVLEKNGQAYWFVDISAMLKLAQAEAFVEIKQVHGDKFYATSIASVERIMKEGHRPATEVDVQGAQELLAEAPDLRPLFVLPPSYDVWMERLNNRGGISHIDKNERMESARRELTIAIDNPNFLLIVNHDFHKTVSEIEKGVDSSLETQESRRELARKLRTELEQGL